MSQQTSVEMYQKVLTQSLQNKALTFTPETTAFTFTTTEGVVPRHLGSGAFGATFAAFDTNTNKTYALEVLSDSNAEKKPKEAIYTKFTELAKSDDVATRRSLSPAFIRCFGSSSVECDGQKYMVNILEYIPAELHQELATIQHNTNPHQIIAEKRQIVFPFDYNQVEVAVAQILMALRSLHQHGIIHQDIKPSNLLLLGPEETGVGDQIYVVKIAGFDVGEQVAVDPLTGGWGLTMDHKCRDPFYQPGEILAALNKNTDQFTAYNMPQYNYTIDLYSAGVIALQLLWGYSFGTYQTSVKTSADLFTARKALFPFKRILDEYTKFHTAYQAAFIVDQTEEEKEQKRQEKKAQRATTIAAAGANATLEEDDYEHEEDVVVYSQTIENRAALIKPDFRQAIEILLKPIDELNIYDESRANVYNTAWFKRLETEVAPKLEKYATEYAKYW